MIRPLLAGAILTLLLCGCASSPPLRYYVLSEMPPATASGESSSSVDKVQVTRITLPGEIDRTELVQRIDTNRLRIAEDDRWAAPLDDLIRRALAADLRQRASGGATGQVSVQIESFSADTSCGVELRASWEWRAPGSNAPAERRRADIRLPHAAADCPMSDVPVRMSEALAQLAARMLEQPDSARQ